MRDHAARILEQAYDPRNGPVGEDVSPRLAPTGMYDAWPLLCKGPFLLPTNEEAAILQGQPGRRMQGAVHERAEDLCYRGMIPQALTDLLYCDEHDATRKRVTAHFTQLVLIYAQRIRKLTYIALTAHFQTELDAVAAEWRALKQAKIHQDPDDNAGAARAGVPKNLNTRCSWPLCRENMEL